MQCRHPCPVLFQSTNLFAQMMKMKLKLRSRSLPLVFLVCSPDIWDGWDGGRVSPSCIGYYREPPPLQHREAKQAAIQHRPAPQPQKTATTSHRRSTDTTDYRGQRAATITVRTDTRDVPCQTKAGAAPRPRSRRGVPHGTTQPLTSTAPTPAENPQPRPMRHDPPTGRTALFGYSTQPRSYRGGQAPPPTKDITAGHATPRNLPWRTATGPTLTARPPGGLTVAQTLAGPCPQRPTPAAQLAAATPCGKVGTPAGAEGHVPPAPMGPETGHRVPASDNTRTLSSPSAGTPAGQPGKYTRCTTTEGGSQDGQGSDQGLRQATPVPIATPQRVADAADTAKTLEGLEATHGPTADSPLAEGTIDRPSHPQTSHLQPPAHPPETQPEGPTIGQRSHEATEGMATHRDTAPWGAHTVFGCRHNDTHHQRIYQRTNSKRLSTATYGHYRVRGLGGHPEPGPPRTPQGSGHR